METSEPAEQGRIVVNPSIDSIVKVVHKNVDQELLITTVDKVRLCLMEHLAAAERGRAWTTPLGICLTILVGIPATTFKDWVFPASTWQAVFLIGGGLSGIWLLRGLWRARNCPTLDELVEKLKKGSSLSFAEPPAQHTQEKGELNQGGSQ